MEAETKEASILEVEIEANGNKEFVTEQNGNIPTDSIEKASTDVLNGNLVETVEVAIESLETKEIIQESEPAKLEDSNEIKNGVLENSGVNNEGISSELTEEETKLIENNKTIKPNGNGHESAPISASNLNVIQEAEESDEEDVRPTDGIPSLDVTIAVEDTPIESQNTTQDLQTNIEKQKGTESRVLSIKCAQILRAKALSRLANIDPSPVRTRTNTPLDYISPGVPWNIDFISIEQFAQLTEFFWGKLSSKFN